MDSIAPHPASQGPQVNVATRPAKAPALGGLFSALLMLAAATSVLSTIAFIVYLVLPVFTRQSQTQYTFLYGIGIVGLAIAEVSQILGAVLLIGLWLSSSSVQKTPKELVVLLLSLIPYMVAVVCLITLIIYLRDRRQDSASERTQEAAQELKERAADTLIDAGANMTGSAAGRVASTQLSSRRTMQDAVTRVVGPSTGKTIADSTRGLVAFTAVVLVASAVTTAGVVLPAHGLAPLQSAQTLADLVGAWDFTYSNCRATGMLSCLSSTGTASMTIQQQNGMLTITLPGGSPSGTTTFMGTLHGGGFTTVFSYPESGDQCAGQFIGAVVTSTRLRGMLSESCSGSGGPGTARYDWTAIRSLLPQQQMTPQTLNP
jgi:hypothetical protein